MMARDPQLWTFGAGYSNMSKNVLQGSEITKNLKMIQRYPAHSPQHESWNLGLFPSVIFLGLSKLQLLGCLGAMGLMVLACQVIPTTLNIHSFGTGCLVFS